MLMQTAADLNEMDDIIVMRDGKRHAFSLMKSSSGLMLA